jgi:hypothetical protein
MRKILLTLSALAGFVGCGLAAPAQADTLVFAPGVQVTPGVQLVQYDGWREREWRRHQRWVEWHRHEEWRRWHHWHHDGY